MVSHDRVRWIARGQAQSAWNSGGPRRCRRDLWTQNLILFETRRAHTVYTHTGCTGPDRGVNHEKHNARRNFIITNVRMGFGNAGCMEFECRLHTEILVYSKAIRWLILLGAYQPNNRRAWTCKQYLVKHSNDWYWQVPKMARTRKHSNSKNPSSCESDWQSRVCFPSWELAQNVSKEPLPSFLKEALMVYGLTTPPLHFPLKVYQVN